eukprot:TRINITY_DN7636_c0_g2_i1.p1 TRINITY_DN7636_c0_g2~~TRINITY_DN7636_c0_g2_i1.p1  ORF type:complete len:141 (+),score=21.48 TRINITY_DN7636_c0_g2_i1:76-498(+)
MLHRFVRRKPRFIKARQSLRASKIAPNQTIFGQVVDGKIPVEKLYEDDLALAFKDIAPVAPHHVLVIPKVPICPGISGMEPDDAPLVGHCMYVASKVAKDLGLDDYRLVVNNGESASQSVFWLHIHVIGGKDLQWPPYPQ